MIVLHHGNPDLYQALEGQKNYPGWKSRLENPPLPAMKPGVNPEFPQNPGVSGQLPGSDHWKIGGFWISPCPSNWRPWISGTATTKISAVSSCPAAWSPWRCPSRDSFTCSWRSWNFQVGQWGHGTVTPRLSCSPCCVTFFYGLHYVAWVAGRRRSCFYGSKHRDFTKKNMGVQLQRWKYRLDRLQSLAEMVIDGYGWFYYLWLG